MINLFDFERAAQSTLSEMLWDFYAGGAWDEHTVRENNAAFGRVWLRPRVLNNVSNVDLACTVLGQRINFPIAVAPSAFHALAHADGELATVRAAAQLGTLMAASTFSNQSLEAIAAARKATNAAAPLWFQLYPLRDRGLLRALVERAHAAGYNAICVTVDTAYSGRRERDLRNPLQPPADMVLGNFSAQALQMDTRSLISYVTNQIDADFSWKDIDALRAMTTLPIVLKGVLRDDDAARAVEHGVAGIFVSNHGGRQLDGAIASIRALPTVAAAVRGRAEIFLDGGVRRGTDVLKALALGAHCVFLGRPIVWGLSLSGTEGVARVLGLLRDELRLAMGLAGCATVADIDESLVARASA
jgi:4-hydroxymandelate oxidase